ncbi:NAD-dependent epimerase/dehydratase family protein [Amycolatopsis sp. K13G38]|uniref:NAD-dependent epimerase/dehydratase family protein n=1 Tax=Amycolatopsis acididurans TaxID=2724524 RepID=A0ABX1JEF6_9PSEU|nr:NAD-dependent epimerase/dehydratase family protein [Amycolatopsis acididurans]NKQ56881.1 NAD-dependent epimerase/dehydratase family protein [Amycolatopsis acididurans]
MRIVVTGATGNVGTALAKIWRGPVTGLARRVPPAADVYSGIEWVPWDLSESAPPASVLADADAVVHLAWAINPSTADPPMESTNLGGTRRLLDAVARAGVPRLVVASSVAAYGPAPRWQRVSEDWPCEGIARSAYSRGKAELERMLDVFEWERPRVRLTRLRPCAILQRHAGGQFARWLLSPLLPAEFVSVPGFPLPLWPDLRFQAVHASDVAEAISLALEADFHGALNLAAEPVLRGDGLAGLFGATRVPVPRRVLSGLAWPLWRTGIQPLHPGWLALADEAALVDTTQARERLGWRPARDAREVISEFADGLRDQACSPSRALSARPGSWFARAGSVPWGRPSHQSQA